MSLKKLKTDIERMIELSISIGRLSERHLFFSNMNDKRNYNQKKADNISKKLAEYNNELIELKNK